MFDLEENAVEMSGEFQETFITVAEIMQLLNPDEITEVPDPAEALAIEYLEEYLPAE